MLQQQDGPGYLDIISLHNRRRPYAGPMCSLQRRTQVTMCPHTPYAWDVARGDRLLRLLAALPALAAACQRAGLPSLVDLHTRVSLLGLVDRELATHEAVERRHPLVAAPAVSTLRHLHAPTRVSAHAPPAGLPPA